MENIDSKIIRSEAGMCALPIGIISGGFIILNYGIGEFLMSHLAVNWLLWGVKTFSCIYLLVYFIKKLKTKYKGVSYASSKSFGTLVALFSALITAACMYISLEWLFPSTLEQTISTALATVSGSLDSNAKASFEEIIPKLPTYTMVFQLIWCFLFGWIVTLITVSGDSPKNNPFATKEEDDDDDII